MPDAAISCELHRMQEANTVNSSGRMGLLHGHIPAGKGTPFLACALNRGSLCAPKLNSLSPKMVAVRSHIRGRLPTSAKAAEGPPFRAWTSAGDRLSVCPTGITCWTPSRFPLCRARRQRARAHLERRAALVARARARGPKARPLRGPEEPCGPRGPSEGPLGLEGPADRKGSAGPWSPPKGSCK